MRRGARTALVVSFGPLLALSHCASFGESDPAMLDAGDPSTAPTRGAGG